MTKRIQVREMSEEEQRVVARLSGSRKAEAALVKRATMLVGYSAGQSCSQIGRDLHVDGETTSRWVQRFQGAGLAGLRDGPSSGRPPLYSLDEVSLVIPRDLIAPHEMGLPP